MLPTQDRQLLQCCADCLTLISVAQPSCLHTKYFLDPLAPCFFSHPVQLIRISAIITASRQHQTICSVSYQNPSLSSITSTVFVFTACLGACSQNCTCKCARLRNIATGTRHSPAERISSALRRCQEDKWAECFCLAKALGHLWWNGSFCTAGCLSVTATPFIFTEGLLAYRVSDPARVSVLVSQDVSAQCEGSEGERTVTTFNPVHTQHVYDTPAHWAVRVITVITETAGITVKQW